MATELIRRYAKLYDVRDFEDPVLLRAIEEILPERDAAAHVERKVWEFAMLALFLEEVGALHDGTDALAVGAGDERMVYWLANRVGRVVATDVYGTGGFSSREAHASMLEDPRTHAPFSYRQDRLETRWMDARRLDFPDSSFDVVFSLSSIEHVGHRRDTARAAREMGRVLRPGGHAFVATDCLVALHPLDRAAADFAVRVATWGRRRRGATGGTREFLSDAFTPRELTAHIVRPSRLRLMQALDRSLSEQSWANLTRQHADGRLEPASGDHFPHTLLTVRRSVFTSVCLPLEKPPSPAG